MTEDDTFNALKRTPFNEVLEKYLQLENDAEEIACFLIDHNWNWHDWSIAYNNYVKGQ